MNKKSFFNMNFLLIILLIIFIIVFIYGISVIKNSGFGNVVDTDYSISNIENFMDVPTAEGGCFLNFDKKVYCFDEIFTGTIEDGDNSACVVYVYDGMNWNPVYTGTTDSNGILNYMDTIPLTEGNFDIKAVCDSDNSGDFTIPGDCITNTEYITIEDCSIPAHNTDDTWVGGEEGSQIISGSGGIINIDMSDITEGNCQLYAVIDYTWDYVNEEACYGQGIEGPVKEGMKFEFHDSNSLEWSKYDTYPQSHVEILNCGLDYIDGIDWEFKASKSVDVGGCEIQLDYDIDVLTCNCQDGEQQ